MDFLTHLIKGLEIGGALLFMIFFGGFCVFIHELGHFLAAKWCGLHIVAFSLGFKKAWSKKINGVDYRLGWLPFGGYVDLPQIDTTGVPKTEDGKELPPAKPVARIITAFAGPCFNILFGLALGCIVWFAGIPQDTPKMREIVVDSIDQSGPEYRAGLRENDRIYKLNDKTFYKTWNEFVQQIIFSVDAVTFDVKRGDETFEVAFVPEENPNAPENLRREKLAWPFFTARIPITLYPEEDSPAARAGIMQGDIPIKINGVRISGFIDFHYLINTSDGKPINMTVDRDGELVEIKNIIPVLDETIPETAQNDYKIGIVYRSDKAPLEIINVVESLPAGKAGIMVGDVILKVDGRSVASAEEFMEFLAERKGEPFTMTLKRGDKTLEKTLAAHHFKYYTIGVQLAMLNHPSPWQQFVDVLDMSYKSLRGIGVYLGNKMQLTEAKSTIKPSNLSGPLGLGRTIFISVYRGSFMIGIYFVTMISFALAIFNLLPLPVLDGGHITLAVLELVFRRPLHEGAVKALTFIFIFLLISLMLYVTYYDVLRLVDAPVSSADNATTPAADAAAPE